jgi:CheY-like chemotaxis protein
VSSPPREETSSRCRAEHRTSVLFVDDDVDVLGAFGNYLKIAGLDVTTFSDPWYAIEAAVRMLPDVIVLDVAMPGLNGYNVIDALRCRQDMAAIPVVLFSGWPREPTRELPQVRAHVAKPCMPGHLLAIVRMLGDHA